MCTNPKRYYEGKKLSIHFWGVRFHSKNTKYESILCILVLAKELKTSRPAWGKIFKNGTSRLSRLLSSVCETTCDAARFPKARLVLNGNALNVFGFIYSDVFVSLFWIKLGFFSWHIVHICVSFKRPKILSCFQLHTWQMLVHIYESACWYAYVLDLCPKKQKRAWFVWKLGTSFLRFGVGSSGKLGEGSGAPL